MKSQCNVKTAVPVILGDGGHYTVSHKVCTFCHNPRGYRAPFTVSAVVSGTQVGMYATAAKVKVVSTVVMPLPGK